MAGHGVGRGDILSLPDFAAAFFFRDRSAINTNDAHLQHAAVDVRGAGEGGRAYSKNNPYYAETEFAIMQK
jgi:hypothetical protein